MANLLMVYQNMLKSLKPGDTNYLKILHLANKERLSLEKSLKKQSNDFIEQLKSNDIVCDIIECETEVTTKEKKKRKGDE